MVLFACKRYHPLAPIQFVRPVDVREGNVKISKITRVAAITLVLFFSSLTGSLLMPLQARASNFQDLWWNPSESGWGVNIAHQADTLFATWFIYDHAGNSTWVVMSNGAKTATNTYSGPIYRTTGPAFSAPFFDALAVTENQVGTATFIFTDPYRAMLTYTVDGVTVRKTIMRQTFKYSPIAGSYLVFEVGTRSGCTLQPSSNGPYTSVFEVTTSVNDNNISWAANQMDANQAVTRSFTLSGNFDQYGALLSTTLTGNLDPGVSYSQEMTEVQFTENGLMGKAVGRRGDDTCVDTSIISGIRTNSTTGPSGGDISLITPYVNSTDIASVTPFSSGSNSPWGWAHTGIDFMPIANATLFRAAASGVVENVILEPLVYTVISNTPVWQASVIIRHDDTYRLTYVFETFSSKQADGQTQLNMFTVSKGQVVAQGEIIGASYVADPAVQVTVDFGLLKNNVRICPENYFTSEAKNSILNLIHKNQPTWVFCF